MPDAPEWEPPVSDPATPPGAESADSADDGESEPER
jgi:hypothetical protein